MTFLRFKTAVACLMQVICKLIWIFWKFWRFCMYDACLMHEIWKIFDRDYKKKGLRVLLACTNRGEFENHHHPFSREKEQEKRRRWDVEKNRELNSISSPLDSRTMFRFSDDFIDEIEIIKKNDEENGIVVDSIWNEFCIGMCSEVEEEYKLLSSTSSCSLSLCIKRKVNWREMMEEKVCLLKKT